MFSQVTAKTTLTDLVGLESHLLLDTHDIASDWLRQPVNIWPMYDGYRKAPDISAMLLL